MRWEISTGRRPAAARWETAHSSGCDRPGSHGRLLRFMNSQFNPTAPTHLVALSSTEQETSTAQPSAVEVATHAAAMVVAPCLRRSPDGSSRPRWQFRRRVVESDQRLKY